MKISIIFSSYQFSLWKDLKANNRIKMDKNGFGLETNNGIEK